MRNEDRREFPRTSNYRRLFEQYTRCRSGSLSDGARDRDYWYAAVDSAVRNVLCVVRLRCRSPGGRDINLVMLCFW